MPILAQFNQDSYAATDEVRCISIYIPNDDSYLALVAGLLAVAGNPLSYIDPESVQAEGVAAVFRDAYIQTTWEGCVAVAYPTIDLFCLNGEPLAGAGTLTYNASTTLPFGYAMSNANTTLFGIENDVYLPAGDYEYIGWSSLSTNGGNTEVVLTDGASVIDSIVGAINQAGAFGTRVKSTGTFTVPADGEYKIVAANNGTGSGSNRQTNWTSHHIRRVA